MQVVPHLRRHKQILPFNRRVLFQEILNRLSYFVLIGIEPGTFEVAVADFQRVTDSLVRLAFGAFVSEGTEADAWDGDAVACFEGYARGHFAVMMG